MKAPDLWTDEMSIDVNAIDADHQILFYIIMRTRILAKRGSDPCIFGTILADLYEHAACHFEREEAVMKACGYPHIEKHMEAHQKFMWKIDEVLQGVPIDKDVDALTTLLDLLETWLVNHIVGMDKDVHPWVESHRESINIALQDQAVARKSQTAGNGN